MHPEDEISTEKQDMPDRAAEKVADVPQNETAAPVEDAQVKDAEPTEEAPDASQAAEPSEQPESD